MPKIYQHVTLEVTPEKFLDACSAVELKEVELLLFSKRYKDKMSNSQPNGILRRVKFPCECGHWCMIPADGLNLLLPYTCEKCNREIDIDFSNK